MILLWLSVVCRKKSLWLSKWSSAEGAWSLHGPFEETLWSQQSEVRNARCGDGPSENIPPIPDDDLNWIPTPKSADISDIYGITWKFGLVLKVWSCFTRVSCSLRGFCGQRFPRRRLGNPCLAKSRHHQETQAERPVAAAAVPSLSATGHARCVALLATVDLSARKTEDRNWSDKSMGWSRKWFWERDETHSDMKMFPSTHCFLITQVPLHHQNNRTSSPSPTSRTTIPPQRFNAPSAVDILWIPSHPKKKGSSQYPNIPKSRCSLSSWCPISSEPITEIARRDVTVWTCHAPPWHPLGSSWPLEQHGDAALGRWPWSRGLSAQVPAGKHHGRRVKNEILKLDYLVVLSRT